MGFRVQIIKVKLRWFTAYVQIIGKTIIITVLIYSMDAVVNCWKAFDTVAHKCFLLKLDHCG